MKMQLANLAAYLVAARLVATGYSAPLAENHHVSSARSNDMPISKDSVERTPTISAGESLPPFFSQANHWVARALDDTTQALARKASDVEGAFPKLENMISERKVSRKKKPARGPAKKKPSKGPTKKKPAKDPAKKKPAKGPAKKKPAKACSKKQAAKGTCKKPALKLEFTEYPKGKQHWTPPKVKRPAAERRLEPTTFIQKLRIRNLEKRAKINVDEGKTRSGQAADEMRTWHVVNCIAVAAYDNDTGAKAMAHINGVTIENGVRIEYDEQWTRFANVVYKWRGPVDIWIRWPHSTAIPPERAHLKDAQKALEDDIRRWVQMMRNSPALEFKIWNQQASRREGDMIMDADGNVAVDTT